jgi:hypothetical protein
MSGLETENIHEYFERGEQPETSSNFRYGLLEYWSMSWLQLAAGLIRDAMNSGESTEPAQGTTPAPPADISGIVDLIDRHRAEIDKNFETVAAMLNVQNEQRLRTIRIQKWWNYGLAAAVVFLAILWIVLFNSLH